MSRFWEAVEKKAVQMRAYYCTCNAIGEPHTKADCTPMHHALNWHKQEVLCEPTVASANETWGKWQGRESCATCAAS